MSDKDTLYARWLNGELSASELEQLKASGALEELEGIIKATDQSALPSYDLEEAYSKFKSNYPKPKAKVRQLNWKYPLAAAAAALLLVVTFFLFQNTPTTILAENKSTKSFNLLDGSNVLLNDGSSISFNESNWPGERNIKLSGEAFFEVEKGNAFIVETALGQVEVLGTEFNVRAWGSNLYVECYEGSVRVSTPDKGSNTTLSASQAVFIRAGKLEATTRISNNSPNWTTGISRFNQEKLQEVFFELERQFNVTIEYTPVNRYFTGDFSHVKLDQALIAICKPLGLSYSISEDEQTVTIQSGN